jgi:hypothetical protein
MLDAADDLRQKPTVGIACPGVVKRKATLREALAESGDGAPVPAAPQ